MRIYFILILASIVLASCGTDPEELPDWCWTYDFRATDNGFGLASGQWVDGIGLQTIDGDLSFSYVYSSFVEPTLIYVTVQRETALNEVFISTAGIIYGVSSAFSVNIPSGNTDIATASFTPDVVGDAGNSINVTIDAVSAGYEELNIISIQVLGNGTTPFPHNPCEEATPTATSTASPTGQATATATLTPSPTATATATLTPSPTSTATDTPEPTATDTPNSSPSPTPDPSCANLYCIFDHFNYDDATINSSNWGYSRDDHNTITSTRVNNIGHDGGVALQRVCTNSCPSYNYMSWIWNTPTDIDSVALWIEYSNGASQYNNDVRLFIDFAYEEILTDDGMAAVSANCEVIPQGTAYTTMTKVTFSSFCANSKADVYAVRIRWGTTSGGSSGQGIARMDDLVIRFTEPYMELPTSTPIATSIATGTITPIAISTNTPYNYQPTLDLTQVTATPNNTPLPTGTDLPQSTAYATMTIGAGTPTLSVEEIRENEAEWELLEEEKRGNNTQENLLQDILDELQGNGEGEGVGEDGTTGQSGASDWANAVSDSLTGIESLTGKVGGFLSQGVNGTTALVTSFYTAPPTSISGLPQCITAPLEHDICAIYFILDWTLFSPNTVGSFIIPLLTALLNVAIITRTLRYILGVVNRTEDVTR